MTEINLEEIETIASDVDLVPISRVVDDYIPVLVAAVRDRDEKIKKLTEELAAAKAEIKPFNEAMVHEIISKPSESKELGGLKPAQQSVKEKSNG